MISINEVKQRVGIYEVAEYFGLNIGRNNMCLCPFHADKKSPSLKLYPNTNSFYCFGCGAAGDTIKFVQLINNVNAYQAADILNDIFGLGLAGMSRIEAAQARLKYERKREAQKAYKRWENDFYDRICQELYTLRQSVKILEPLTEKWGAALLKISILDYVADIFISGSMEQRIEIYREDKKCKT